MSKPTEQTYAERFAECQALIDRLPRMLADHRAEQDRDPRHLAEARKHLCRALAVLGDTCDLVEKYGYE